MALTDIIVLVVIGAATGISAALLRRRGVRGRELRTSLWLCFYGTVLVAMMAAHNLEVVYRAFIERADPPATGSPYDFRLYSMLLLGALLIGAGVVCLRAVPAVSRGSAEARKASARASAFVLAIVAPLIPIQPVFGIALTVLSLASLLLLTRRSREVGASPRRSGLALTALLALAVPAAAQTPAAGGAPIAHVRVNQVGYLPEAPKVAVVCSLRPQRIQSFSVLDESGRRVYGPARARADRPFGPCAATHRLDFSALREEGRYRVVADDLSSPVVRIASDVYAGAADTLLYYMRQQRSGFNPLFRVPVHTRTDGILVDHPRAGEFIPVAGGWADAADYLQYVTTSANATFVMLMAARDHPAGFSDRFDADGLPGANGLADALDEARHGLEWLVKMFPEDSLLLNQLGDDRDHAFLDLPPTDSSDYGWGRGRFRPVYPCTGRPQGIVGAKNRANGYASTAGKYASAMALGAQLFSREDSAFAALLARKAVGAYALGRKYPGVCQTAPGGAPYFYEEDNWLDDMELGAAQIHALTGEARYLAEAREYAAREPVTPWMGADTASHYQWYPWHNSGHYEVWRRGDLETKRQMADYYRRGLQAVAARADNGFRIGIPFIWCSNNLMASYATQAYLYRRMTGDDRFREYEQAALDWLFGTNPWGVSMIIGYPAAGNTPRHPHSVLANQLGVHTQLGGMLDGPVYRNIFQNLRGIRLFDEDEYAAFNTGFIVYHDDFGDYSTNEPIMDGTANLTYLLAALAPGAAGTR